MVTAPYLMMIAWQDLKLEQTMASQKFPKEVNHEPDLKINKNSIQLSGPALFYENHAKLYFDTKHLKIGLNRVL